MGGRAGGRVGLRSPHSDPAIPVRDARRQAGHHSRGGATARLPRLIGRACAMEMMLMGEPIDANSGPVHGPGNSSCRARRADSACAAHVGAPRELCAVRAAYDEGHGALRNGSQHGRRADVREYAQGRSCRPRTSTRASPPFSASASRCSRVADKDPARRREPAAGHARPRRHRLLGVGGLVLV